ncbi:hypothetical protein [Chryseobacterium sp.]|uniref:hypothetical protein n=1 Tax=Chryseobacterium sp. TaxID=1871047 RepID=UPI0024E21F16|nr:hypothetical protein [Chryseobacterium sp.]
MTKETFEKAKKIDDNIATLYNRKALIKRVHSQLLRNEVDTEDVDQMLKDYMELVNFAIEKETKEFNEL